MLIIMAISDLFTNECIHFVDINFIKMKISFDFNILLPLNTL